MKPFDVFPLFDVNIVKGNGCHIYDDKGNEYIDLYGGHAVISVGHAHPHFVKMVSEQLERLNFYSNSVHNPVQVEFAHRLGIASGYPDYDVFFVNSGAEANENALKLASFHNGRRKVISVRHAFHGRTTGAVRITDNPKIVAPINEAFEVEFVELNDIDALRKALRKKDACAFMMEGIQGVGGIQIPTDEFYKVAREECTASGTIMVLDEIQSGYGRTGRFFAHQRAGIKPDLITVAKGIACGIPMGALLISPEFKPIYGQLGSTFGGNPLACAAGIAVLDIFEKEHCIENASIVGAHMLQRLSSLVGKHGIIDVRGEGLMIGIEFDKPIKDLRTRYIFEQHVFTGASGTSVLRLLPPLTLPQEIADEAIDRLLNIL
ncbi:MAG: aspartate aminotransferase family protein [Paludibacteraceae bacterium]|nr:aspartate aminotransferase family protein [Paludibacteraceae bacterium]